MSVALVALRFNHALASATTDALTIRPNRGSMTILPEWEATRCIVPEDSPAAYAMSATFGNPLTLLGKFRLTSLCPNATVQAIPGANVQPLPNLPLGPPPDVTHTNVLGTIPPTSISFDPSGESDWITLPLSGVSIWDAGVGIYDISWDWYYRCSGDTQWTYIARTRHRIYVTLALPTSPWVQTNDLFNTHLPWTDALDYACSWASGAKQPSEAAEKLTAAIHALGSGTIAYDPYSFYSYPEFKLTEFVQRLRGGVGAGGSVNCSDCATILSTFANLLGCDFSQSKLGYLFDLNPMLSIGSSVWGLPAGLTRFFYHEVAWAGNCTATDPLCDACLQVDGLGDPTTPPHAPLLPVNMVFGTSGYRDRLAAPLGRPNCNPDPSTKQRRALT
ncbi:MAG: hypothetical protein L0241_22165 [Planctomycetia bacterium]|nr:hypothetical protein [Planctomycetia bacterium]